MTTKQKIIVSSIKLFNLYGLTNVRLQQIADEVGISVGNLAYHYYSKKAIVKEIDRQLSELLEPIIDEHISLPSLMDFDTQIARYYHLLKNYSFYFLDLLEFKRNYPKLYEKRKRYIQQIISQIENWLELKTKQGILREEPRTRHNKIIAHTIWMIITFYLTQPINHGTPEDSERVFKECVWSQILSHFTEMGRLEFDLMIERLLDSFTPNLPIYDINMIHQHICSTTNSEEKTPSFRLGIVEDQKCPALETKRKHPSILSDQKKKDSSLK